MAPWAEQLSRGVHCRLGLLGDGPDVYGLLGLHIQGRPGFTVSSWVDVMVAGGGSLLRGLVSRADSAGKHLAVIL